MIRRHNPHAGIFAPRARTATPPAAPKTDGAQAQAGTTWSRLIGFACLLPIIVTAVLSGYFLNQARYNGETYHSQSVTYPYTWHAQWITATQPTVALSLRKTFLSTDSIASGYLAVVGDNFYELRVNGSRIVPFFSPSMNTAPFVGGQMETPDTQTGNPQFSNIAQIYNIGPYVRMGRNVITLRVQSDRGLPKVLVQGRINRFVGGPTEILSDGSWKYNLNPNAAPYAWTASTYDDVDWPHVVTTRGPMDRRIDGRPSVFLSHPAAAYIGGPTTALSSIVMLRKHIFWNGTSSDGWLRVSTTVPYDITLNGKLLATTSTATDYASTPFSRFKNIDILERSRYTQITGRHIGMIIQVPMNVYALHDVFQRGDNDLQITLQDQTARSLRTMPTVYADGFLSGPHGRRLQFGTDGAWQAGTQVGDQVRWTPARISSLLGPRASSNIAPSLAANIYPRPEILLKVAVNAAVILLGLLLIGYGVASLMVAGGKGTPLAQKMGAPFVLPAAALICCACIQGIFIFSPQYTFFATTQYALICLGLGAAAYALIIALSFVGRRDATTSASDAVVTQAPLSAAQGARILDLARKYVPSMVVGALMLVSGFIATHTVSINPFVNDEYVSLLCARGIVHTGKPLFEGSGVIYGRSALYHYLLAPFVAYGYSIGDLTVTRYLSAIWQLALIPLSYLFAREMKGRKAGMAAAALVALSPFLLFFARETRFYAQFAFFSTLTFYLLYKAIRNPDRPWYRVGVILAFAGAYHSQELAISLIPAMVIVILTSGQIKLWLQKLPLMVMAIVAASVAADMFVYFKYCVTPLPYVDRDAMPLLALHTDSLDLLTSMVFVSYDRLQIPLLLLFGAGLIWEIAQIFRPRPIQTTESRAPWSWHLYMYVVTLVPLITLTVLLPIGGARYAISVVPPLLVMSGCIAVVAADRLYRWLRETTGSARAAQGARIAFALLVMVTILIAYRPLRTFDSTERVLNRDHTGAARYVADHALTTDKLMFFNPQAAMVECGRCDYNWTSALKSLYKYAGRDGRLRERDSGALVVDNMDKLKDVVAANPRVWLVTMPITAGRAGMTGFVFKNFVLVHETLGMQVWLWDRDRNVYRSTGPSMGYGHLD